MDPTPPADLPTPSPGLSIKSCGKVLAMPARWAMLKALAKEGALPAGALAGVGKCSPQMGTKHIACLKKYGLIVRRHRSLYGLAPQFLPQPGAQEIDLGPCKIPL